MFARMSDIDRMLEAMGLLRGRLGHVFDDFDRSFDQHSGWLAGGNYPRTNLVDRGEFFELGAEVPGLSREDIKVRIQGNYLEISGTRKVAVPKGYRVHRSERGTASFTRSLTLPADVDSDKVSAALKDGILVLRMPKSEAAKPRQISIK